MMPKLPLFTGPQEYIRDKSHVTMLPSFQKSEAPFRLRKSHRETGVNCHVTLASHQSALLVSTHESAHSAGISSRLSPYMRPHSNLEKLNILPRVPLFVVKSEAKGTNVSE